MGETDEAGGMETEAGVRLRLTAGRRETGSRQKLNTDEAATRIKKGLKRDCMNRVYDLVLWWSLNQVFRQS